jgi:branched-chain amino acid transport system substrate-binding protein
MRLAAILGARGRSALAIFVIGTLVATACGDDDDSGASTAPSVSGPASTAATATTGATATTAATATTVTTAATATTGATATTAATATTGATGTTAAGGQDEAVVTDYLSFTGGTAGAADQSMSPIAIGWVNGQGGTAEIPEATAGAQAAVDYVNAELGGIGGHPIELHTCFIADAEEEGQTCGQQLANDDDVSIIAFGAVVTGNQSFYGTLGGAKPVIIGVSANPADNTAENVYALYGTQTSVLGPWGTYARDVLHAETAAIVFPSQAGANSAADATKAGLEAAGITVQSVGYEPENTDLLGPLTAAGGQDADVVVPMTDVPGCSNLANALKQIGSQQPVVSNPLCLAPPVAEALGGDLPQWTYGIAQSLPSDTTAPDSAVYLETSAKYGLDPAAAGNPFAALAWAQVLTIAKFMNAAGPDNITPDTMMEQVQAFEGPLIMGAPSVDCGYDPDEPASCNNQTKFYTYKGQGQFEPASDWLRPPE